MIETVVGWWSRREDEAEWTCRGCGAQVASVLMPEAAEHVAERHPPQ